MIGKPLVFGGKTVGIGHTFGGECAFVPRVEQHQYDVGQAVGMFGLQGLYGVNEGSVAALLQHTRVYGGFKA